MHGFFLAVVSCLFKSAKHGTANPLQAVEKSYEIGGTVDVLCSISNSSAKNSRGTVHTVTDLLSMTRPVLLLISDL